MNKEELDKTIHFFYKVIRMNINNELKNYFIIFEEGNKEVHKFTDFLDDRMGDFCLKNKSYNTIKNFYLTFIIRFLNFIFNNSEYKISNIEDLKLEHIEEFLDKFSQGNLKTDKTNEWKSKQTVDRANHAISYFVYWLFWKKEKNTNKKQFKMKNLKIEMFDFRAITMVNKYGCSTREVKQLIDIVVPDVSNRIKTRDKVVNAGNYTVEKLLEVSELKDPMMTFGIALGAYLGLRIGDILQMHRGRIKGLLNQNFGSYVDLTNEIILRSDFKITSNIKTKRKIPIYPGCAEVLRYFYLKHLDFLKSCELENNKYGALFVNKDGIAMSERSYFYRFEKLSKHLQVIIKKEVAYGNKKAIHEEQILTEGRLTPHSLRHYYKQLIENAEPNRKRIQYYLAHKNINSQDSYAKDYTEEGIRKVQDSIYKSFKSNL